MSAHNSGVTVRHCAEVQTAGAWGNCSGGFSQTQINKCSPGCLGLAWFLQSLRLFLFLSVYIYVGGGHDHVSADALRGHKSMPDP